MTLDSRDLDTPHSLGSLSRHYVNKHELSSWRMRPYGTKPTIPAEAILK